MAKKWIVCLVLAALVAGGVFAQESAKRNWVSGEVGIIGAGARYEFMLTNKISVGANVYWNNLLFFWNELGIVAVGRFYPLNNGFHVGLGLGYTTHSGTEEKGGNSQLIVRSGLGIVPEVGWKIDPGKPGAFFLDVVLQVPITIGKKDYYWFDEGKDKVGVGFGVRAALGLGYAF